MALLKGNERSEVTRWIVDLETMLDEMNQESVSESDVIESHSALSWLRRLLADTSPSR